MSDEEQIENLQMLLPEEQTEVLNFSDTDDLNLWMAEMMLPHFCH